jgi:hypothetical protein
MDVTKKAVVEPPKSAAQPVKAQQQPEHAAPRASPRLYRKSSAYTQTHGTLPLAYGQYRTNRHGLAVYVPGN